MTIVVVLVIICVKTFLIPSKMYLNYNSTFMNGGKFNPSDLAYDEVQDLRMDEERVKSYIKTVVGASDSSEVIFNSGATEGIATVINWAKQLNCHGSVLGSQFDHSTVEDNCKNQGLQYHKLEITPTEKISTDINTGLVFVTHVSPTTGEIYPIENLSRYHYLSDGEDSLDQDTVRQYRPIIAMDISQSIGKIPVEMKKNKINAVFFSMHKIGGVMNTGVLVIDDQHKFVPLIAGNQQHKLRGGTYNLYDFLDFEQIYTDFVEFYDHDKCKKEWAKSMKQLDGLNVYKPKFEHLHNTILIDVNHCNAGIINQLSGYGIYVGGSSACSAETPDQVDTKIRISFLNSVNHSAVKKIIKAISEEALN